MNTSFSFRTMAIGLLLVALIITGRLAFYFHGSTVKAGERVKQLLSDNNLQVATIVDMQARQREVALLDTKYTKELAIAKAENDVLQRKLVDGGRVFVKGTCSTNPATIQATGTVSVGNDTTVELSPDAGSNVLDIRAGIISDQAKVRYLQQYISEQCNN
ncbi:TPA: lysis protein [Serratia liquefaciens]|nr:lysis protein [Serratia liquefaciens]